MNPLIITAIITGLTVTAAVLSTIVNPIKFVPFILTVYFAVIVMITK